MKKFANVHVHTTYCDPQRVEPFLEAVAKTGVTDLAILSLCSTKKSEKVENLSILWWKSKFKKYRISAFGALHEADVYAKIPYEVQAEKLLALGCDGMKFIHMKPDVRKAIGKGLDHPDYDKMFSIMEERGIPAIIHSGDPEKFWDMSTASAEAIAKGWCYGDGTYLSCQEHYEECFRMLDKHPKLNAVFAHMFFLSENMDEAVRILEKYPNVSFDLTPGTEMYPAFAKDIDAWHDFFEKYSDRILFGTDSGDHKYNEAELHDLVYTALTHDSSEFEMPGFPGKISRGLYLSEKAVENICYNNYERLIGGRVAPVDMDGVVAAAKQMLVDMKDTATENDILWLENFIKSV